MLVDIPNEFIWGIVTGFVLMCIIFRNVICQKVENQDNENEEKEEKEDPNACQHVLKNGEKCGMTYCTYHNWVE